MRFPMSLTTFQAIILIGVASLCTNSLLAQGTVVFNNRVATVLITYVYAPNPLNPFMQQIGTGSADTPSGTTDWSGFTRIGANGTAGPYGAATTLATLLGAPGVNQDPNSLQPSTIVTSFRSGTASGNVAASTAAFNNIPKDAPSATIQMVAWDNSSGQFPTYASLLLAIVAGTAPAYGKSNPFNLANIGGDFNTPPNLIGLTSFSLAIVPEPTSFALLGLGAAILMFRGRKNAVL